MTLIFTILFFPFQSAGKLCDFVVLSIKKSSMKLEWTLDTCVAAQAPPVPCAHLLLWEVEFLLPPLLTPPTQRL